MKYVKIFSFFFLLIMFIYVIIEQRKHIDRLNIQYTELNYHISIALDRQNCLLREKTIINKSISDFCVKNRDKKNILLSKLVNENGIIVVRFPSACCIDCALHDIELLSSKLGIIKRNIVFIFSKKHERILRGEFFNKIKQYIFINTSELSLYGMDKISKPYILELDNSLKVQNSFILSDSRKNQKLLYYEIL